MLKAGEREDVRGLKGDKQATMVGGGITAS